VKRITIAPKMNKPRRAIFFITTTFEKQDMFCASIRRLAFSA
jgi:hypothetical protein